MDFARRSTTPSETELFTRSEVLAGLPARRAQTALYLIESRTARLVARSAQALDPFLSEAAAAERDLAFVDAFARGKPPPLRPTIQDLEHHATSWRELVPESARGCAALARLFGQKYQFTRAAVPGIRDALQLDQAAVAAAYDKLYGQSLQTIYAARPALAERLRWTRVGLARWFENLPPFWAVFALTLTETIGVCILALPIALAGIGPIPGIVLLGILGLVNVLTIIAMAEAVARNGAIRYGQGFLSRMVEDYLGPGGARILWAGNVGWDVIGLLIFCLGFATTLAAVTPVPGVIWGVGLLLIALMFLRQESLNATVTTALAVGGINMVLLFLLSLLALTKLQPDYVTYVNVPLLQGQPLDVAILGLIFGTILGAYAAHPSVGISAKFVLPRDPSGRSLIWGVAAAQVVAIVFYCVWVLAVNGAVAPEILAEETGTALIPLVDAVGPAAGILGSFYVVLAMTIGTVYCALRLFNLVRERLPRTSEPIIRLPRRQGRLVMRPRTGKAVAVIGLTYLGLARGTDAVRPRFRVDLQQGDTLQRVEIGHDGHWDESALRKQWTALDRRLRFALRVQEATRDSVLVQISTPLAVRYEGEWDTAGLHAADLLALPADTRSLLTWLLRCGGATEQEIAVHLGQDIASTRRMVSELVDAGVLAQPPARTRDAGPTRQGTEAVPRNGAVRYRPQFAYRRRGRVPDDLWRFPESEPAATGQALAPGRGGPETPTHTPLLARLGPRGRFWLAASPTVIVFLVAELLLWTDTASFSNLLSFIGVVIASLLAGIFPVLLLAASRRKGDFVPATVYRVLGQPWLLGSIYLLFIGSIFLHGLVIWQDPIQRLVAVLVGLVMAGVTWTMVRQGVFAGRAVVEVSQDLTAGRVPSQGAVGDGQFAISALGKPALATVHLVYAGSERVVTAASGELPDFGDLRQMQVELKALEARDVKIWAHHVTPEGQSESLPVLAEIRCSDAVCSADLRLTGGQAVLPLTAPACCITLYFEAPKEPGMPAVNGLGLAYGLADSKPSIST